MTLHTTYQHNVQTVMQFIFEWITFSLYITYTHIQGERERDKKRNIKTYPDMHRNRATGEVEGDHVQEQSKKTL